MNLLDLFTWLAAVVLIAGSTAIFVWFLCDVRSVLRRERAAGGDGGGKDVA